MAELKLSDIDKRLMSAEGRLLTQQVNYARGIAARAQDEFNAALTLVIKHTPMRDRPPVDAVVSYDEDAGALVWDSPLPALPPAPEDTEE